MSHYAYRSFDSSASFGVALALPIVPFVVSALVAGEVIDRWGASRVLWAANLGGMLNLAILTVETYLGVYPGTRVWVFLFAAAALKALHLSSFEVAVPYLVPKDRLTNANGGRMALTATGALLGPVVGAALLVDAGFYGVVLLGALAYTVSFVSLLRVRMPRGAAQENAGSAFRPALHLWRAFGYLRARPGLLSLYGVLALGNAVIGAGEILLVENVLSFADGTTLNGILLAGAAGMICGTMFIVLSGGLQRRVQVLVVAMIVMSAAMFAGGLRPNAVLIGTAAFLFLASTPVIIGLIQTLLQVKVEAGLLGRTAALRAVLIDGPYMTSEFVLGFLLSTIFVPIVGSEKVKDGILRSLLGDGPGRGYALAMIVIGAGLAGCVYIIYRCSGLRRVERSNPDVLSC